MFLMELCKSQREMKLRDAKYSKYWVALILTLVLISASGSMLVIFTAKDMVPKSKAPSDASHKTGVLPNAGESNCSPTALVEPFYGMEYAYLDDLSTVRGLGIEVIMTDVPHDAPAASWLAFLDAAQVQGLRVILWLWPQGWTWNGTAWQFDAQARLFLQTVANHPALLAVYALHEPYWNGCDGCGYSTATQQALYSAIKAIAKVRIYSELGSIADWTAQGPSTAFADGVCDYCAIWYYPFKQGGVYERDKVIAQLTADLAVARERAPKSKIVWGMQSFAQGAPYRLRMPSAAEMEDLASIVYSNDLAGGWWYPWKFNSLYNDFLFNHQELYPVVRNIYTKYVQPAKPVPNHCIYLPIIYNY
jgi:hypothetical protein